MFERKAGRRKAAKIIAGYYLRKQAMYKFAMNATYGCGGTPPNYDVLSDAYKGRLSYIIGVQKKIRKGKKGKYQHQLRFRSSVNEEDKKCNR